MEKITVNFRCPEDLVTKVDEAAEADHRDRTNMLIKILADHFKTKPARNGSSLKASPKPAAKKKAAAR